MLHQIIEIGELMQLVADHLIHDSPKSLVSLACACRALEEQALSTLWSEQPSLATLVKSTLLPGILSHPQQLPQPTRIEWDRFRRYASWMRRLHFDSHCGVSDQVLRMISVNSSNEILCPRLRELYWETRSYPLERHFLSPHLRDFSFLRFHLGQVPDEILSNLTSVIAELETSSLRSLRITIPQGPTSVGLESAVSSTILRCGPSLTTLSVPTPLSDAAIQHIMRLPKLARWSARNGPPGVSDLPLSDAFPQLEALELHVEESLEWLPLFQATARRTSPGQGTNPLSYRVPGRKLTTLIYWAGISVDAASISPVMSFHGLAYLALRSNCYHPDGCGFGLTDDDMAEMAAALPNLVDASFGYVCTANSCRTTVSSLLFLSTRCKNLEYLEVHFNTRNLRDDLKSMPENPRLRDLYTLSRCRLVQLSVSYAPLRIDVEDYGTVLAGFLRIFPSLRELFGEASSWGELNSKLCNKE